MTENKELPLKIELFPEGEDSQFRVDSKREIQAILNGIAQEGTRAALYHGDEDGFILTQVLKVNEQGMWLNTDPVAANNQIILHSNKIIFISSRHRVKVQFLANHIEHALLGGCAALYLSLPDSLLRIQRREYFRLATPASNPLRCVIPVIPPVAMTGADAPMLKRELPIMDISGGGIALECEAHDSELQPGQFYEDCRIALPGVGAISTTIRVKNSFENIQHNGQTSKRAGCEFTYLSGESATLLQRYVVHLQGERLR